MNCPACNSANYKETDPWAYDGKVFQKMQCAGCKYKSKAWVVDAGDPPTQQPSSPQQSQYQPIRLTNHHFL